MKYKYLFFVPILIFTSCQPVNQPEITYFKVVFDANGGAFSDGETRKEISVEMNKTISSNIEDPIREDNYIFRYWYRNSECTGDAFTFRTPITENMTLYARWLYDNGLDSDYDGINDVFDPAINDNNYFAHLIEDHLPKREVNMPVTVNYTYFLSDDKTFNKDLEKLGNICAIDIYKQSMTTLNGLSSLYVPKSFDDDEELYKQLGCNDIIKYVFNKDKYEIDKFDTYTCILAHHRFRKDDENYEVLFITNQGTDSEDEWYSDFDIGVDNEDYAKITGVNKGEHIHWINNGDNLTPIHHKGFDVTMNREYNDVIKPYVENYIDKQNKLIIFNTGHSRGGAIANLLGKKFNDEKETLNIYKNFTYTYASPTTIYNPKTKANVECPNIFNILNQDDLVPELPLKSWNYYRYGSDCSYKVSDYSSEWDEYNNAFISYEGPDIIGITDSMKSIAESREDIYSFNKSDDTMFVNKVFDSNKNRDKAINEYLTKADLWYGRNTISFDASVDNCLKGYNCPVSLMNRLSVVLGNINEDNISRITEMMGDGMICSNYTSIEINFFLNGTKLITAHRGATYYFISSKLIDKDTNNLI